MSDNPYVNFLYQNQSRDIWFSKRYKQLRFYKNITMNWDLYQKTRIEVTTASKTLTAFFLAVMKRSEPDTSYQRPIPKTRTRTIPGKSLAHGWQHRPMSSHTPVFSSLPALVIVQSPH